MRFKTLLLMLTATIVALLVAEVLTRLALRLPGVRPLPTHAVPGLLIPHPTRHYAYTPNFVGHLRTEDYEIDIRTNALGLRDDDVAPGEEVDILATGDSFTVGFGVQAEEAWPAHLEAYLNSASALPKRIRVLNAAISGYSLTQIRLLLESLLDLNPRIVVLGLYPAANLRRVDPYVYCNGYAVLSSMRPHVKATDDAFLYSPFEGGRIQRIHFWLMEHFHLGAYILSLFHSHEAPSTDWKQTPGKTGAISLVDELGMIHQTLSERGIGLVVLMVSSQKADGTFAPRQKEFNTSVARYCADAGITVFDPLPLLESTAENRPIYRIGNDHHWSRAAHALVAMRLGNFMLDQPWVAESLGQAR
jgi:hypothetical protein